MSFNRLVFLDFDFGRYEFSFIGDCLSFFTGLRIDVGSVLLTVQIRERQTLTVRINNHAKAVSNGCVTHVHGVLTSRQALLCQRIWHHLVPVALLINQVDVTIYDLVSVLFKRVVEVLVTEQAEVDLTCRDNLFELHVELQATKVITQRSTLNPVLGVRNLLRVNSLAPGGTANGHTFNCVPVNVLNTNSHPFFREKVTSLFVRVVRCEVFCFGGRLRNEALQTGFTVFEVHLGVERFTVNRYFGAGVDACRCHVNNSLFVRCHGEGSLDEASLVGHCGQSFACAFVNVRCVV